MYMRRCFMIFTAIVGLSLFTVFYVDYHTISTLAIYAFTVNTNHKIILFWNTFFGSKNFYLGHGHFAEHCPKYNNCFTINSRFVKSVDTYDAVIFHGINGELDTNDLPAKRHPSQKYVFVALESPVNRYISHTFDDYFNTTMTYKLDSDIIWTYSDIVDKENESIIAVPAKGKFEWKDESKQSTIKDANNDEEKKLIALIEGKKKLAVWYRSNCETRSRRELYVAELEKHMSVAKYGMCSKQIGCFKNQDCLKTDVEPNYFFYLSFENSLCDDYVTEKFFNVLKYNVVPVVYGGANYSFFAPPKSYINALDFNSPKDLAIYLTKLTKDVNEYKKYFAWKRHYRIISPTQRLICELCELLNTGRKKTVAISKWYNTKSCPLQNQLDKQISDGGLKYATKNTSLT